MSESTPIRVAQMMTDMNYGGVEMVVMNYYRHIDRSKVQFDFFALEGSAVPQQEEIERLGGHVYLVPRYTHLVQYERAILELFRKNQYQIVHSHMNTLGVFSLWGAQRAGVPNRIMHNHSVAGKGETKKNFVKYLLRPFAKIYPTQLCACSESAGRWLYGDSEFRVFNNAIDLEKFSFDAQKRAALRKELGLDPSPAAGGGVDADWPGRDGECHPPESEPPGAAGRGPLFGQPQKDRALLSGDGCVRSAVPL